MGAPKNFFEALEMYLELDPAFSEKAYKYLTKFNRNFESTNSVKYRFEKWYFHQIWQEHTEYVYHRKIIDYYNNLSHYTEDSKLIKSFLILEKNGDSRIISTIIAALGKCGEISDLPILKDYVNHLDERTAANSVEAIGNICFNHKHLGENDFFRKLLDSPNKRVKANAALSIWVLEQNLNSNDKNIITMLLSDKSKFLSESFMNESGNITDIFAKITSQEGYSRKDFQDILISLGNMFTKMR
ncbi:hypothetical protein KAJ27_15585 [bacterium]|nr:hypothetical protein [bacterium]